MSHSIAAPFRAAAPFKTFNWGHCLSGILHVHTVVGKFQPEPDRHVNLALCVHSGAKPGTVHDALLIGSLLIMFTQNRTRILYLHTDPAHFHSPPSTGFKSVRSHFLCGVVVVVGALVVEATDLSLSILLPGDESGF